MQGENTAEIIESPSLVEKVTDFYIKPRSFERKLYEKLGIRKYQKLWHMTLGKFLSFLGEKPRLSDLSDMSLEVYENTTKAFEGIHLAIAALSMPLVVGNFVYGGCIVGSMQLGIQALVNYYPIMLQRYNRARVHNILERREARKRRE